ncbi:hypothetical protein [Ornithinimicrobium sp. INDO-MA30-4]|uniref:hypothetical protein n=1 Tax=Ornithinimicrobium sp. INDO-MA30-4 TaxID=2908651 RepID=UPI001F45C095|nr:hypothetical protein [Ornithinimicrobium sp. INDO-MA30-4]UJH69559.1 hypothetical protein L0A91_09280 [Ornithinimicrobium sp. INDO-MA30-4]
MTLRAALRSALTGAASTLDSLVDDVLADAGSDAFKRYRLVPPDMLEQEAFHNFWSHESVRTVEGDTANWSNNDCCLTPPSRSVCSRPWPDTGGHRLHRGLCRCWWPAALGQPGQTGLAP